MKTRLLTASLLLSVGSTFALGQVAQAISASITTDSVSEYLPQLTMVAQSVTSAPRTLDFRCSYNDFWVPADEQEPPAGAPSGAHSYGGYVRVKWIGASPPSTTTAYSAKFQVYSASRVAASITWYNRTSPSRSFLVDGAIGGPFLYVEHHTFNPVQGYSFDADPFSVGTSGVTVANIFSISYPWVNQNQNWDSESDYATEAYFSYQGDGYYANFSVSGATAWSEASSDFTFGIWYAQDEAAITMPTRIIYRLVEVAGQPVSE